MTGCCVSRNNECNVYQMVRFTMICIYVYQVCHVFHVVCICMYVYTKLGDCLPLVGYV